MFEKKQLPTSTYKTGYADATVITSMYYKRSKLENERIV